MHGRGAAADAAARCTASAGKRCAASSPKHVHRAADWALPDRAAHAAIRRVPVGGARAPSSTDRRSAAPPVCSTEVLKNA